MHLQIGNQLLRTNSRWFQRISFSSFLWNWKLFHGLITPSPTKFDAKKLHSCLSAENGFVEGATKRRQILTDAQEAATDIITKAQTYNSPVRMNVIPIQYQQQNLWDQFKHDSNFQSMRNTTFWWLQNARESVSDSFLYWLAKSNQWQHTKRTQEGWPQRPARSFPVLFFCLQGLYNNTMSVADARPPKMPNVVIMHKQGAHFG